MIRILKLPRHLWRLAGEAAVALTRARVQVSYVSFQKIVEELDRSVGAGDEDVVREVSWAIHAVSRRLPWRCTCLVQALAARRMLARRGTESRLCLGVRREDESNLGAHAWLECGDITVTGSDERDQFPEVASF